MWPSGLVTLTDLSYLGTCTVCTLAYCHGGFRVTGTCFKDIEIPIRYKVTYLHIFTCLKHVTTTQPQPQPQTTYLILFFFLFLLFFLILRLAPPGLLTVTR